MKPPQGAKADLQPGEAERIVIEQARMKPVLYGDTDLNAALAAILQCLSDISARRYYGTEMLLDVLRGSPNERLTAGSLDRTEGYGALKGLSREALSFILEWMIANGYMLRTKGRYPVLHPTDRGLHYSANVSPQKLHALKRALYRAEAQNFTEEGRSGRKTDR